MLKHVNTPIMARQRFVVNLHKARFSTLDNDKDKDPSNIESTGEASNTINEEVASGSMDSFARENVAHNQEFGKP